MKTDISIYVMFCLAFVFGIITGFSTHELVQAQADPVLRLDVAINASEDSQMEIRPSDTLPANGTVTMSMEGADDIDYKGLNPIGVTTVITNETVTVTNQPIQQEQPAAPAAEPEQAPEAEPEEEEE